MDAMKQALSMFGFKKDNRRPSQPEITEEIVGHILTSMNRLPKATKLWQLAPDDVSQTPERSMKNPSDVAFLEPFTFAVADSVGHRIQVFDISRDFCSVIGDGDIWPNCVAITRDNKIVATDRRRKVIKTYDVRGDLLSTWDPGEDVLVQPHGIAVTSRGETIVTDAGSNRVYVFSGDGQISRQFGSKGDLLQHLHLPFYVTVDRSDVILVSDNMNYCVKSFDVQGNYLRKIGSGNGFGQRQFQCPYGVCLDPGSQELLVADSLSNRVFAFRSDGKFQRYLLTANADGCLNPCGIAVGPCGTLVVTEANPDYGNVKAFALYESVDGNHNIEGLWSSRTESAI